MDTDSVEDEIVQFEEDDNIMAMKVTNRQEEEFPREEDEESETEDGEIAACNNNATVSGTSNAFESSSGAKGALQPLPGNSNDDWYSSIPTQPEHSENEELNKTLTLMQEFMVEQGVMNKTLTPRDLQKFLKGKKDKQEKSTVLLATNQARAINGTSTKVKGKKTNKISDNKSEVTIYLKAVKQLTAPELNVQINELVSKTRMEIEEEEREHNVKDTRKFTSSEEMDTSDEAPGYDINLLNKFNNHSIVEMAENVGDNQPTTMQEHADYLIKESEKSKAQMYNIPGRDSASSYLDVNRIDQDYHMIDSHIDESVKRRIQAFEYIDFSKLISRNRF